MIILAIYIAIFAGGYFAVKQITASTQPKDYTSLKTVTFGDESAVRPNRAASIISVVTIFLLWGAFTGSSLIPSFLHAPAAFTGTGEFSYTVEAGGQSDDATVTVNVHEADGDAAEPVVEAGDGFAKNDVMSVAKYRSKLLRVDKNDELGRTDGAQITAVNGQAIAPGGEVFTDFARIGMTPKGTLNIVPNTGWQMQPLYLPPPEKVASRLAEISSTGFRNSTLWEHLGFSLFRVVIGFLIGAAVGIPLGYAMGLSNWFRGWFDPVVEFMRPVPPLALIPLVIIWAGIGEVGKIVLLFLAALWIMAIAARSGVSGVNITKVHAAYSLGASKWQIMRHVIIPNSLPEIFTGARVAMGVCWGTVVAAELVAAEKGAGMMIMVASKFQNTDIVLMGIILIGVIGFSIDVLMRWAENILVPWKGRS
ncbi:ABC transporter permease subunit [uncultured Litoreibacter sp.]|uniref:ABC transporter permease n=1 Tax=uncultured Litoreibacter sp. TaxID=1392394 RepID=UPI00261F1DE3|nr:ABC transporter permease subunit [uncultured Litoreibacter sp.]